MGGAGKTQLALVYCRKEADSGRYMATLWVDANSPTSTMQNFRAIANMIDPTWSNATEEDALIEFVKFTISKWRRRWLMIFDSFDEPKAFEKNSIYHYFPKSILGSVLFTSRNHGVSRLGEEIEVANISKEEGLRLLLRKPAADTDQEKADGVKIVGALGYLALAIDQAGAYICEQAMDLEEFLPHYRRRQKIVLQNLTDTWEYSRHLPGSEEEKLG
jgi:hypothetical protein